MTTQEDKKAEARIDKLHEAFYDASWDVIYDMKDIDMKRSEITKIMIRDLKSAIEIAYEDDKE